MASRRKPPPDSVPTASALADALRDSAGRLIEAGLDAIAQAGPAPGRLLQRVLDEALSSALERHDAPLRAEVQALARRIEQLERRIGALGTKTGAKAGGKAKAGAKTAARQGSRTATKAGTGATAASAAGARRTPTSARR